MAIRGRALNPHRLPRKDWARDAECARRGLPLRLFYPPQSGSVSYVAYAACAGCPVRLRCLNWIMEVEAAENTINGKKPRHGFWGGLTAVQRTKLAIGTGTSDMRPYSAILKNSRSLRPTG